MKRKLFVISLLMALTSLTSCGSTHEHTFYDTWCYDALSHWREASCEHKELTIDRGTHIDLDGNGFCDVCNYEVGHEHTYSDNWSSDEYYHWHAATCPHTDEVKDKNPHDFNENWVCKDCGYEAQVLYPVITKIDSYSYSALVSTSTLNWSDDYLGLILTTGDDFMTLSSYYDFNEDGYLIEEGDLDNETKEVETTYLYEGDLLTLKTEYGSSGEPLRKYAYEYNLDKTISSVTHYECNNGQDSITRTILYTYEEESREEFITYYRNNEVENYYEYKWTISMVGNNRKELYEKRNSTEGPYSEIGYVIYNELEQVIETKSLKYNSFGNYYVFKNITYTEDGGLESVIEYDENDMYGTKMLCTYDHNGFIVKQESFSYNQSEEEYNILISGTDYEVDSRGTIIKSSYYEINDNQKVEYARREYEIKYAPIKCTIDYTEFVAETKGTYNAFEIRQLSIID